MTVQRGRMLLLLMVVLHRIRLELVRMGRMQVLLLLLLMQQHVVVVLWVVRVMHAARTGPHVGRGRRGQILRLRLRIPAVVVAGVVMLLLMLVMLLLMVRQHHWAMLLLLLLMRIVHNIDRCGDATDRTAVVGGRRRTATVVAIMVVMVMVLLVVTVDGLRLDANGGLLLGV